MATRTLGVAIPWGSPAGAGAGWTRPRLVEFSVEADRLGYHSIWVPEAWGPDALTMLGFLAARTTRIRLATGIVNVFSRSPALLAQSIASLDELSEGRAILGLGASGARVIEDWHGVPFDRALLRTRECVEIVRLALSGRRVDYDGQLFHLRRFRLATESPPRADLPIFIAGFGPRNLALVGELADGWIPIFATPASLPPQLALVAAAALSAGRDPAAIEIAPFVLTAVAADDRSTSESTSDSSPPARPPSLQRDGGRCSADLPARDEAEAALRGHLAFYLGGMGTYYNELAARLGFAAEAASIASAWADGRRRDAAAAVTPAMLHAMAVCGTAAECSDQLAALREAGATLPIIAFPIGTSAATASAALAALAPQG